MKPTSLSIVKPMKAEIGDIEVVMMKQDDYFGVVQSAEILWEKLKAKGIDPTRPFFHFYCRHLMSTVIIQDELAPPHAQRILLEQPPLQIEGPK